MEADEIDLLHSPRDEPDRRRTGYRTEAANSRFKLLLVAFRGVATKHLDNSLPCFERVDPSRLTSPRARRAAASTQPRRSD